MNKVMKATFIALLLCGVMSLASGEAHAQGMSVRDPHFSQLKFSSSGIEIKLTPAGINDAQAFFNAKNIAKRVVNYVPKAYKSRPINLNKLGLQIQLHAIAYAFRIKRNHANPVNVTWQELR